MLGKFGRLFFGVGLFAASWYLLVPAINPAFSGVWYLALLSFAISFGVPSFDEYDHYRGLSNEGWLRILAAVGAFLVLVVVTFAITFSGFHATAYRELLGPVTSGKIEETLPALDMEQAPLVSPSMAERAAEKRLAEVPALGSQVEIGTLEKQIIAGKLYYVGFLEHRSWFKWWSQTTTVGYVQVSAHNADDVHLIQKVDGKPLALKYLNSAYGFSNARRHVRTSGYLTEGIGEFIPEIDDTGRPYLVAALFESKVGFRGHDAVGAVVLDVQTGAIQRYSLTNLPAWIDRIHPEAFIEEQITDFLHLVNGWFNPADTDRLAISGGLDVVYGSDGKSYYFAGLTSVAREGGLVGFMMVNTRTKEVRRFMVSGVTEPVAQSVVEGVMPEKRYTATTALPFLVNGNPVYVMALRDATGVARAYGIVSLTNFQKNAVADTVTAALRQFHAKVAIDPANMNASTTASIKIVTGKIGRIASEVRGGNSQYTLTLVEDTAGHLYVAGPDLSEDLAVSQVGDVVEVKVVATESRVQNLQAFVNKTLAK